MRKVVVLCFLSVLMFAEDGAQLYAKCKGCHGLDGKHIAYEKGSPIAGRDKEELKLIMVAIRDGNYKKDRVNFVMRKVVSKLTEPEIEALSAYINLLGSK
ncbi:MAG: c-type cytochrome [Sulfurospirillaceae bacterium]|nr:c-type cytochrome [Sulfurospirillaceae bacterium]MDD3462207.1 c-type cytochrome [Sulfurospirillaceae bacterium]